LVVNRPVDTECIDGRWICSRIPVLAVQPKNMARSLLGHDRDLRFIEAPSGPVSIICSHQGHVDPDMPIRIAVLVAVAAVVHTLAAGCIIARLADGDLLAAGPIGDGKQVAGMLCNGIDLGEIVLNVVVTHSLCPENEEKLAPSIGIGLTVAFHIREIEAVIGGILGVGTGVGEGESGGGTDVDQSSHEARGIPHFGAIGERTGRTAGIGCVDIKT